MNCPNCNIALEQMGAVDTDDLDETIFYDKLRCPRCKKWFLDKGHPFTWDNELGPVDIITPAMARQRAAAAGQQALPGFEAP